jgi:protein-L-isoaspartate(D-aspartate) O-methyltransferase
MSKKLPSRFPLALERVGGAPAAKGTALLRPQRLLHDAAREFVREQPPSGIGMDSSAVRARMVERLRAAGIRDEVVLSAFASVARHEFVDTALATQAYEDTSLPIGHGQTISKPSVVARMLCLLRERPGAADAANLGAVLEIGTGCGYQTALLALLSRRVVSIERLQALHAKARENLAGKRGHQVRLVFGDGRLGHAPNAPFDAIVAAAGGEAVPPAWLDQLAEGGRLVAPMHDAKSGGQLLLVIDKRDGVYRQQQLDAVHFVPLKSGTN